jgi:octaprenyl-diphosphate synthase
MALAVLSQLLEQIIAVHRVRLRPECVGVVRSAARIEGRIHDDVVMKAWSARPAARRWLPRRLTSASSTLARGARWAFSASRSERRAQSAISGARSTSRHREHQAGLPPPDPRPRAGAKIGERSGGTIGNGCGQQHGIHAGTVTGIRRLDQKEPAIVEGVDRVSGAGTPVCEAAGGSSADRPPPGSGCFVTVAPWPKLLLKSRIDEDPAGLGGHLRINQNAARNHAHRPLQNAHAAVSNQAANAGVAHQAFDKGDEHRVIGTDKIMHGFLLCPFVSSDAYQISSPPVSNRRLRQGSGLNNVAQNGKQESGPVGVVVSLEDGKHKDASVKPLVEKTRADMERVNQLILSKAGSDVAMIPEVANHLISSGGKAAQADADTRVRHHVRLQGESHIKLATAVEFMHTATLLHDDVVDESDLRRGRSTARMIWGNQASVLVGDFLLGQAFKMMVEVGSLDALDVLSTAASVIAEGEVLQLSVAKNMETTEDDYLSVIRAKTAALFSAACEVGPIVAGQQGRTQRAAFLRDESRPGVPAHRRRARLWRLGAVIWARMSAMISVKARSPCRWFSPTGAGRKPNGRSGAKRSRAARTTMRRWKRRSA